MKDERGFTLVELLVAASLMVVVLGATLAAFENFQRGQSATNAQNDLQDNVRNVLDRAARELRNGASPASGQTGGIDKATPTDLVMQIVNPSGGGGAGNARSVRRVRYCLDSSVPSNERLIRQVSATWTSATAPAPPSTASCPDGAWPTTQVVSTQLVNNMTAGRPLFCPTPGNPCPGSASAPTSVGAISRLQMSAWVDNDTTHRPPAANLVTGLYFRNQTQAPTAAFEYSVSGGDIFLNASDSASADGSQLTYSWTDNGTTVASGMTAAITGPSSGDHTVGLTVTDPGGLSASTTQTVTIP